MPEVLLSNDSLTVLGGPASVNIGLDVGPSGKRGSAILLSNGNPNIPGNITQTPSILDLAVNVNNLDDSYKYVYQYLNVDGVNTWVQVIDLSPGIFATRFSPNFVDGQATIEIPFSKIVQYAAPGGGIYYPEMFTLNATVNGPQPAIFNAQITSIGPDTDGLISGFPTNTPGQEIMTISITGYDLMISGSEITSVTPFSGTGRSVSISIQLTNYTIDPGNFV